LDVVVGGRSSYCDSVHCTTGEHRRSDLVVFGLLSYCGCAASYCGLQTVSRPQSRLVDDVRGAVSYSRLGSHTRGVGGPDPAVVVVVVVLGAGGVVVVLGAAGVAAPATHSLLMHLCPAQHRDVRCLHSPHQSPSCPQTPWAMGCVDAGLAVGAGARVGASMTHVLHSAGQCFVANGDAQ